MRILLKYIFVASPFVILFSCRQSDKDLVKNTSPSLQNSYLNHSDSAKYVGKSTCMLCHQDIYTTFVHTGMGKSLSAATKAHSSASFDNAYIQDKYKDFHYQAFLFHDSIYFKEYRVKNKDSVFMMIKKIDFIIGSGQHTNSHLYSINGYLYQAPMTFYTQKKMWDLPPGFENGHNTRFFRKIGVECITCHNAYPLFVIGSENKYAELPTGIDCERCHGPGSIHVNKVRRGEITDTSKYVDYSIVNPAKLSIDLQFDLCMRCHLQGNAVLVNNQSFFDFKPGKKLNQYIQVFLARYTDSKDNFIMASHADRLKQSECFIQSFKKSKNTHPFKPYQNALTCVTCHNPHVSVKVTKEEKFNNICSSCHYQGGMSNKSCTSKRFLTASKKNDKRNMNCISCHMPVSGSKDIPHVSIHDHFIRIPDKKQLKAKEHQFLGLVCINDSHPSKETRALAYIYQYEKFDLFDYYLDSAESILNIGNTEEAQKHLHTYIHLLFLKKSWDEIDKITNQIGIKKLFQQLCQKNINNTDSWTLYRIADAKYALGKTKEAEMFYEKAVLLSPYILEFKNKLAVTQMQNNKVNYAYQNWIEILKENPMFVQACSNLGFLKTQQDQLDSAFYYLQKGYNIDPDNEMLLLNTISFYLKISYPDKARELAKELLRKYPNNIQAKTVLNYLK